MANIYIDGFANTGFNGLYYNMGLSNGNPYYVKDDTHFAIYYSKLMPITETGAYVLFQKFTLGNNSAPISVYKYIKYSNDIFDDTPWIGLASEESGEQGTGTIDPMSSSSSSSSSTEWLSSSSSSSSDVIYGWIWNILDSTSGIPWTNIKTSSDGKNVVACTAYEVENNGYIYTSNNYGDTWTKQIGADSKEYYQLTTDINCEKILLSPSSEFLYYSNDGGITTTAVATELGNWWSFASISQDGNFMISEQTGQETFYASNNGGVSWFSLPNAGIRYHGSLVLSSNGSTIITSHSDSNLIRSYDYGETWENIEGAPTYGYELMCASNNFSVIYRQGSEDSEGTAPLWISSDHGDSWSELINAGNYTWTSLTSSYDGSVVMASEIDIDSETGYIHISTDYGETWEIQTSTGGISCAGIACSSDGNIIYAIDENNVIFRGEYVPLP